MDSRKQLDPIEYKKGTQLLSAKFSEGNINTKFDYDYLKDIPENAFRNGIKKILENYQYKSYPAIATIRFYCGVDLDSIAKNAIEVKLKRACIAMSDFNSISFTDKALNLVCNTYKGHAVIKQWSEQDWLFNKKAMRELYSSCLRASNGDSRVKGIYEDQIERAPHDFKICLLGESGEKIKYIEIDKTKRLVNKEDFKYLDQVGLKNNSQYKQIENLLNKEIE
jgi:hypothetical protein